MEGLSSGNLVGQIMCLQVVVVKPLDLEHKYFASLLRMNVLDEHK